MMSKKVLYMLLVFILGFFLQHSPFEAVSAQTSVTTCKLSEVGQTRCINSFIATCKKVVARSTEGTEIAYIWKPSSNPCVTPTNVPTVKLSGTIVISRPTDLSDDSSREIFTMNADGSNPVRLTNNNVVDTSPSFSPDGKKIVFTSKRDGNSEIYVMNNDGSNPTRLTNNNINDFSPSFSPDGKKIVFDKRISEYISKIYIMNDDGSNQEELTAGNSNDYAETFSPNGQEIFYNSGDINNYFDIKKITLNDRKISSVLTDNNKNSRYGLPQLSPDGKWLLFISDTMQNKVWVLYKKDLNSGTISRLTPNLGYDIGNPSFSPDGARVIISKIGKGYERLGMAYINFDGSNFTTLGQAKDAIGISRAWIDKLSNSDSIPVSPTLTPTPTLVPTLIPTISQGPNCPMKLLGDADCDGSINNQDYLLWECEYKGNGSCSSSPMGPVSVRKSDFDLANGVTLNDFEIYRQNFYTPPPTLIPSITPTRTPVPPKPTVVPKPTISAALSPTQPASSPTPTPTSMPAFYIVFLTRNFYYSNLGGVSKADSICMQEAQEAGLKGEFKAWLSDTDTDAKDHIAPKTSLPYQTTDSAKTLVANNIADLTDGSINSPIQYSASGEKISDALNAWTGTLADGTKAKPTRSVPEQFYYCDNWTLSDPNNFNAEGLTGNYSSTDGEWTSSSSKLCAGMRRLYCFQTNFSE